MDIDKLPLVDRRLEALGVLLGFLERAGENLSLNAAWFNRPTLSQVPARRDAWLALLDSLMEEVEGKGRTLIGNSAKWYSINSEWCGDPTGLCVVTSGDSGGAKRIGLGFFDQSADENCCYSLHAFLPISSWKKNNAPEFLLNSAGGTSIEFCLDVHLNNSKNKPVAFDKARVSATISLAGEFNCKPIAFYLNGNEVNFSPAIVSTLLQECSTYLNRLLVGDVTIGSALAATGLIDTKEKDGSFTYALGKTATDLVDALASNSSPPQTLTAVNAALLTGWPQIETKVRNALSAPLRFSFPDYTLPIGGDAKVAVDMQLGKWLSGESDKKNWTHAASIVNDDEKSTAGIEIGLFELKEGAIALRNPPTLKIQSIGFDIRGNGGPLFDINGYTLTGAAVRFSYETDTGKCGFAVQLDEVGFPLAGPPKTEKKSLASDILASGGEKKDEKKGEKKESGSNADKNNSPYKSANPVFSVKAGFGKSKSKDPSKYFLKLLDAKGQETDEIWLPIQKDFGPVRCNKLGVIYGASSSKLGFGFDGNLSTGSLNLYLNQLSVNLPLQSLATPTAYTLDLKGMDFALKTNAVAVTGGFLKKDDNEYFGQLGIQLPKVAISAIGAYSYVDGKDGQDGFSSLVIYGTLSIQGGGGIPLGPAKITGMALGMGLHRQALIPAQVEDVKKFPLVTQVIGSKNRESGGTSMITELVNVLPVKRGHNFGCIGLRFTLAEIVDCFALAVAQFGSDDLDFAIVGLAKLETPVCYAELAIKMALKPAEGSFLAQAQLTDNSWVIDKKCKLTGGFAMAFWFGGANKGDFVLTLGGYHPRFKPPAHYPVVPRVGVNWPVSAELQVKGELYFAVTPSMLMAGGRLEAAYRSESGRISAWFTAYVDFLMEWAPLRYEANAGVAIRVHAETFLKTIDLTAAATVQLWGTPFGGIAEVDLSVISFTIKLGEAKKDPEAIDWKAFGKSFLDKNAGDAAWSVAANEEVNTNGPALCQPRVVKGMLIESARTEETAGPWIVRADELEFAAATPIPLAEVRVGEIQNISIPTGNLHGKHLTVKNPIAIDTKKTVKGEAVGIRPMKKSSMAAVLNVGVVDKDGKSIEISGWKVEAEKTAVPASLWDTNSDQANEPSAKVIRDCTVGLKCLKPGQGKTFGTRLERTAAELRTSMDATAIAMPTADKTTSVGMSADAATQLELLRSMGFQLPAVGRKA